MSSIFKRIIVGSTKKQMAVTALRYALTALGGYAVTKGIIPQENLNDVVGAGLILIPGIIGTFASHKNNEEKKTMASMLPDDVAVVK